MGYEELVELGFEGVDRVVDKYHDPLYDYFPPAPWKKRKQQQQHEHQHQHGHQEPQRQTSPPQQQRQERRSPHREHSERGEDHDRDSEFNRDPRRMYSPERRGSWGDEGGSNAGYGARIRGGDRGYYAAPVMTSAVVRRPDYSAYQVAARAPSPPPGVRPQYGPYTGGYDTPNRGRPDPRRRPSSYSPPRRELRQRSPPRRARSKSPNHHRAAATLVGALAGGFLGNAAKKGDTLTTVAGAVIGGLGGREIEKLYDRHEDKKAAEDARRERRREERRRQDNYYG